MHHIARAQTPNYLAHQAKFATAFALIWPDGCIQRRTSGQADHHDQPRQRKPHACGLAAGLGIHSLVLGGIGHGQPGAIH